MRRLALPALPALAAIALAGCGGSSSLSSSQLHVQATSICTVASTRTNRIPTPASPDGSAAFLQAGIAALTPELSGLRALRPPNDVASVYTATVGSFAQKLRDLQRAAQELARGDDTISTMQSLGRKLEPLEADENSGWQALQLPACLSR